MSTAIEELFISLGVKFNDDGFKKATSAGKKAVKRITVGFAALSAAGTAAFLAMADHAIDQAKEFDTWSKKIGATTTELQALEIGAEQFNVEADNVREGVKTMRENLGELARIGTGPARDALGSLGLQLEDIKGLGVEEQLGVLSDALLDVEDPAKQLSIAIELMGDDGAALLPVLQQGSAEINRVGQEARQSGRIMDEDMIKSTIELDQKMKGLKGQLGAASNEIVSAMLPAITDAADGFGGWIEDNEEFIQQDIPEVMRGIVEVVKTLAGAFMAVVEAIADARRQWELFLDDLSDEEEDKLRDAGVSEGTIKAIQRRTEERGAPALPGASEEKGSEPASPPTDEAELSERRKRRERFEKTERRAASGGGGGKTAEQRQAEEELAQAFVDLRTSGLEEDLRDLGLEAGATEKAIEASVKSAAEELARGASDKVARERGVGTLSGFTGRDLAAQETDPLLSAIFGDGSLPDAPVSEVAQGMSPQVLISTINNNFDIEISNLIDGAGNSPADIGSAVVDRFRDLFENEVQAASKLSKVNFAR